jgi:2-succinyl-5-enolpyruvyl-6-hydroxy-3-cyclohexene-1-carboxylate synthase
VDVSEAAAALAGVKRGVIVCGPRERADGFGEAVHALGRHLGWPVLAEAASNARYGFDDAVAMYDVLLRDPRLGPGFAPEAILRFGGGATPKSLIGLGAPTVVLCSEDGRDVDPHHHAGVVVDGAAPAVARALRDALPAGGGAWRERWLAAEAAVRGALASGPVDGDPGTAGAVMRALPVGARVIVGSSMPIRDVDAFAPVAAPGVFVYANRGVNGIDGVISTAVGVARAGGGPTVALVGDLTLLHDVGAWLTARRLGVDLVVVVVNNDGGGIFHFLPVRDRTSRFEEYFGTSHGADLAAVAALGGARLHRPVGAEALASAIAEASDGGLHLIEVRSDREANVELHRSLFARLAAAVP